MSSAINTMITSGDYRILLDAVKGFRNGFVYGVKIRTPHALVMTLLFNRGPIDQMALRIFNAAKLHGKKLAQFAFVFKLLHGLLGKLLPNGGAEWHAAVGGAICGALFWGEQNPIVVQVNMYVLSRILSGWLYYLLGRLKVSALPPVAMRLYAAVIWACMMFLFYHHPATLQNSLQGSMNYIYRDSDKYTNLHDLFIMNKPGQI